MTVTADPFTNPYLLFALEVNRRLAADEFTIDQAETVVQAISTEGALARAERLGDYLGIGADDPLEPLFERLAERGFDVYAAALATPAVGLVTTGHPTFALNAALSLAIVELATGHDAKGQPLSPDARTEREAVIAQTPHLPPPELTLDVEHEWSVWALANTADALDLARRAALAVGRRHWPDQWTTLKPALMTLATWVGFDQDGRSDVTWAVSFGKRLALKHLALNRYLALVEPLALPVIAEPLRRAILLIEGQDKALAEAGDDAGKLADFSRKLIAEKDDSLVDPAPLLASIDTALSEATTDEAREALVVLRAGLETQGVCLAHIHVRLNSTQLHNAIRREVDLRTSPSDPSNRRTYIHTASTLIETCEPVEVGFRSLLGETSSARRLFMTIAVMARYIDGAAPVRFLIAETESGFTLLVAQYLARLFGVEKLVELSPLFETETGLERGEVIIEEALRSPHFRDYLKGQGRLALEFGFSDSGRFIGQMAATFRIERLRLRLGELMEREELTALQLILYNTHGESMGRGGHPDSLRDRLDYAAPPRDRREFARRGIRVREEDSFQGGEGYLPLFTLTAARATVAGMLAFGLGENPEAEGDPIYAAQDFASEFFATVQQAFTGLAGESDYAALLGLFGPRLLPKTGSRPVQRQSSETGQVVTFTHVSELRAIPNNGILQGMGNLANLTFGMKRAASKDPHTFETLRRDSPRFRRALQMAKQADSLSDLQATRAYAATVNPSLWLDQVKVDGTEEGSLRRLSRLAERAGLTGRLSTVLRHMRAEPAMAAPRPTERRTRVQLLHGLRIALIQRICVIAARIPEFTPRAGFTLEQAQLMLMRLDIPAAVARLEEVFPARANPELTKIDFGETDTYAPADTLGYGVEHETLFQPLLALYGLLLRTTTALGHECGACG
jgi:phosphoenolpyruvate carboxylase